MFTYIHLYIIHFFPYSLLYFSSEKVEEGLAESHLDSSSNH